MEVFMHKMAVYKAEIIELINGSELVRPQL